MNLILKYCVVDLIIKKDGEIRKKQDAKDMDIRLTMLSQNEASKSVDKSLAKDILNNPDNIPEARALERRRDRSDKDGLRSRMYDNKNQDKTESEVQDIVQDSEPAVQDVTPVPENPEIPCDMDYIDMFSGSTLLFDDEED